MKVITVCGMGLGTSLMLLMEVQSIAAKHGFDVSGEATDLGSALGRKCDFFVASSEIASQLASKNALIVGIKNIIDKNEIENKIVPVMQAIADKRGE